MTADFGPYGPRRDHRWPPPWARRRARCWSASPYAVPPGGPCDGHRAAPIGCSRRFSKAWTAHGWPGPSRAASAVRGPRGAQRRGARPRPLGAVPPAGASRPPSERPAGSGTRSSTATTSAATTRRRRHLPAVALPEVGLPPPPTAARTSSAPRRHRAQTVPHRALLAGVLRGRAATTGRRPHGRPSTRAWRRWRSTTERGADARFDAWAEGRTGYPIVDAGMRQLAAEGWMHNRVRMLVASFLVKDLHLDWRWGARSSCSTSSTATWRRTATAGSGWPARAPMPRPTSASSTPTPRRERFDPDGAYVRRWVPELAGVPDPTSTSPWADPAGPPAGYPAPIVDHAEERARLARLAGSPARSGIRRVVATGSQPAVP